MGKTLLTHFYMNKLLSLLAHEKSLRANSASYRLNETLLQELYESPRLMPNPETLDNPNYAERVADE